MLSFRVLTSLAALTLTLTSLPIAQSAASDLMQYKELRNDYIKVTDIKERTRTEERYLENAGKVTLQKVPYKEVIVTAELSQKPPSSVESMLGGSAVTDPLFKICLVPFDAADQRLEEICESVRFQTLVKGNVGTALFRPTENTARYQFRVNQKQGDKGSAIKLWSPIK